MSPLTPTPRPLVWRRWTEALARAATRKRLQQIASLYAEIGLIWGDVDQSIVSMADDAAAQVREQYEEMQLFWDEHGRDA